jgi:UDP-N-acetylglucosamine acyltransferase
MLCSDFNAAVKGLNVVGLKRAGFRQSDIASLKKAYQILFRSGSKLEDALRLIEAECPTDHTAHLVDFIRRSERGICREKIAKKGEKPDDLSPSS